MNTRFLRRAKLKPVPLLTRNDMMAYATNGVLVSPRKYRWLKFRQGITLRTKIYAFVYILIMFVLMIPNASAFSFIDTYGFPIHDLYANITRNMNEVNAMLVRAFQLSTIPPFEVINHLGNMSGTNSTEATSGLLGIKGAVSSLSLAVATLLLMVDFFKKVSNFEFVSKWENILMLIVKIVVIKQVIQNADIIMLYIYAGFNTVNEAALGTIDGGILPVGNVVTYTMTDFSISEYFSSFGSGGS
jgi:hypothetical protein